MQNCDAAQLTPELRSTCQDDQGTIDLFLATLDPLLASPVELSDAEFGDLMAFLRALTDPAAMDLGQDIPSSVPSGLPLED